MLFRSQIQDLFYKNSLESYIPEYSLDTPYKYNSAGGLIYKIRFVSYGQKVNTCIANLRSFLFKTASEIVDKVEGIKVKDVHSHGKAIIFDYCTRNFRGFDLPNWRTQEEWFLGIRPYSPTPRNVSPAGSR